MTIPATPDHFLCMSIFGGSSGLPEDVYVNNFIFRNTDTSGGLGGTPYERTRNVVRDFYYVNRTLAGTTPAVAKLAEFIPAYVNSHTLKIYDLGNPPGGRAPTTFDLTADLTALSRTGAAMPPEVAAVLTLQTPIIGKRGKGRIYVGPLRLTAVEELTGQPPMFSKAFQERIMAQAAHLALGNGGDMEWRVWSTTRVQTARVIGGSVDNAVDIQRRRGWKPTSRLKWGTTTPTQLPA